MVKSRGWLASLISGNRGWTWVSRRYVLFVLWFMCVVIRESAVYAYQQARTQQAQAHVTTGFVAPGLLLRSDNAIFLSSYDTPGYRRLFLPHRRVVAAWAKCRTRFTCSLRVSFLKVQASMTEVAMRDDTLVIEKEIGRMISSGEISVSVREARGCEVDAVALLRCRAFQQGKEVFRSQLLKMVGASSPQGSTATSRGPSLMGERCTTSFLVATANVNDIPTAKENSLQIVHSDLDQLLADGWVTPGEHHARKERVTKDWNTNAELVIGSVECAVHEYVTQDLSLTKSVYISSMAVREGFRRRGVGATLLKGAEELARERRGVKEMFLHVEEDNTAAVKLYMSAGLQRAETHHPGALYMDRALRFMLQVPVGAYLYWRSIS